MIKILFHFNNKVISNKKWKINDEVDSSLKKFSKLILFFISKYILLRKFRAKIKNLHERLLLFIMPPEMVRFLCYSKTIII